MDRNHTRRIELTLTGLLLAAILSAGAAYGQVQTKYRDRINLPGVRITREYVDTGEAKTQPVPSPAKSKQGTRRARTGSIPVSPTGNAPMANPDSPTGQPLQIKQLSLDWVDRLIAACNRRGIHDLQYNGEFIEYKDGTPGPVLPARVVVGGWEGCRADLGDVDGDGSRWLMNRWEAWVIRSGQASQSGRQLYPEFHPFLPAVTMAWAFSAMRSDGRLKLLDQGTAILAGQPCRVVEAVHEGCTTDYSPAARLASSEPERHYRLYLDNKDRLVRLDYRGFTYLYGNYIKFLNSGLVLATTVRCYSQGIHRWDHQIDSQSLQEIDRPDPAIFSPESDRQKGLLVMKEDDFSAEKIWNENRPDVMGGDAPFGTFHGDSVVSVNIQNQNLNISIPFVDYPQRGALGLPMGLTYNSKLWDIQCSGSESDFGSTKAPGHGKKEFYSLIYSSGSLNGWRNLSGLYCIQQKREYYDQWGKGVAEEVAVSPLYTGPPLKILPKMYLHMPDGSVHEMMEDNGPGTGDELHDRYSAAGIPYEITTRDWESTDGSQIQVKLGDRGSSYDVLAYDASTLYVANLGPGFRVVDISNPSQIGSQNVDTPWGATRLIRLDNYLLVGTNGAGVQLYDITSPLSPSYVYKSWLNKGGVVDMKYESNTRRLWVLGDGKLRVLDMSRPRYAKELAACDADTGYTYWGSAASPLEVSGQYGYVSQEGEIGIYYCSGTKLSRSPLSFRSDRFRLDHYKCLVQDPAQHKLYALVDTGSGKRVEAFMIEADGQLGQLPLESFTVSRLGNRMVLSGNHLLILGIPSSTGGCGVDTYDRTNPAGSFSSHTLFTTAYRPRSTGLAVSADGSQFFFTGDSWFLSAFNRDAFLDGGSVSLWDYIPVQHDPAIYFPNGTRVILTAEYQTVMDANGNFIRMSQPVNSSGTFTYQDTLGRSGLTSVLPWYTPPTEGGSSPIPGYNPWLDPPPDPIDYTLPGFNGASKTYSFLYRPLSEFATVALTSRGPDLEYIEELPCADNPHALFPASGTSYAPQIVENVTCFNPLLLKQITLPNGRCYLFEYNEYGEITKITYPTTGYEIFEYDRVPLVGWQYDRYANWVNRGVTKRFISAKGDGTDLCAYVYEGEQVLVGGAGGSSTYYRVIQRVKFYADAGQIGGTPDALEEHYFYKVDHRNHWMVAYGLEPLCSGKEYETRLYLKDAASGQMKLHQRVLREYAAGVYNPAIALHHPYSSKLLGFRNPLVTAELTFHFDAAGQPQRASLVTWEYEQAAALNSYFKYGRLIEKKSYDYIDTLNSLALAAYHPELGLGGWIGGGAFGPSDLLRVEKTEYDNTPSFLALDLVQMVSRSWVEDGAVNKVSEALFDYDDPECFDGVTGGGVPNWQDVGAVRGNLSHVSRWIDGANYSADTRTVNRFGRVIQYQDPVAQTTGWEYGDDCSGAYVTAMVKHPEPDLELRTGYDYDCTTGKLLAVADPNEATATFDYADDLDRLTQAVEPNGREIGLAYDDANRIITVTADWDPDTDPLMHQETVRHFDGLGRLTAEAVKVGPASAPSWRWSQREYDARGRLWKVYNPAASQGTVGVGVTTTTYDSLDRVITVENPDQTTRTTQYDLFNVSSTTPTVAEKVSDESGKWKKYSRDSAGRIVQVIEEDPDTDTDGPVTTYAYTPSGKLSEVHQDAQTRSFAYDGLGNLVSAQYPEIEFEKTWEYFDNGQLRREYNGLSNDETPLPQYVLFRYDGMGRIIRKYHTCLETIEGYTEELIRRKYVYSYDGQYLPYQAESFDFGAYALGKLTGKWETWGNDEVDPGDPVYWMELYAFSDPSGRLTAQLNWLDLNDVFSFGPYLTTYGYNLSGGLTGISYPSGKQATFTLDLENKPINAGTESSRAVLASSLTYALHGALDTVTVPFAGETARTDLTYHRAYTNDQMLRVDKITLTQSNPGDLMDFQYSYAANGNVAGITHSDFGGVHSETFEYDKLNRLTSVSYTLDASPGSGSIGYRYDRFGNLNARTVQMPEGATDARSFDLGATSMEDDNRLPESAGAYTFTYDERGNLVAAVEVVGVEDTIEEAFSYDAENRLENYNRTWTDPETELTMWAEGRYFYDDSFRRLCAVQTISQSENEYIHNITTGTIYDLGGDVLTEIIWENGNPFPEQGKKLPSSPQTLSEEAYHYQFLDHLGTTRFIAGMSWQWGLIEEIPQFVQTNTWLRPVNLTPYGSEIREVSGARYEPDALVLFDPILFTGKPRDIESGLDGFGPRYFSNALCRWISPDQPLIDNMVEDPQSWNLFSYVRNNPMNLIDPTGEAAWEIKNQWDDETISRFNEYVEENAAQYAGEYTCEDFALALLVDFASANNLPVSITNDSGTFNASSDSFTDVGGFKETVMSSTGATDLARPENTYPISGDKPGSLGLLDTAKSGDLLLMDYTGAGRVTHTQVVTASNSDIVRINQGNMHWGSSGYGSIIYSGTPVQTGYYRKADGAYIRDNNVKPFFFESFKVQAKRWRFKFW